MEDALNRLHRAIEYAVLATVSGGRDQRGKLYARFAHALTTQGKVNAAEAMHQLPNFDALRTVLPIIVTDGNGGKALHPVWGSADFIAPAVAALAIFFERNLDPQGDAMMSMQISKQPQALFGFRLENLSAEAFTYKPDGTRQGRPMEPSDWMRVSITLSGAALALMKEESMLRFAPTYLRRQVEAETRSDIDRTPPTGRPGAFISLTDLSKRPDAVDLTLG